MTEHKCEWLRYCSCSVIGLEPNDTCDIHGYAAVPRCLCGRFVRRSEGHFLDPDGDERDEDSEYEYAREDAPLLQEDRR